MAGFCAGSERRAARDEIGDCAWGRGDGAVSEVDWEGEGGRDGGYGEEGGSRRGVEDGGV